jgi:hypothetical protein
MIKDDDILLNLKTLTEKVDGISIKAKENIPLVSSEVENVNISILPVLPANISSYVLNGLYVLIPLIIFGLLYHFKPPFVMIEVKVDTFLTKKEFSYLYALGSTVAVSFVIILMFFIVKFKN